VVLSSTPLTFHVVAEDVCASMTFAYWPRDVAVGARVVKKLEQLNGDDKGVWLTNALLDVALCDLDDTTGDEESRTFVCEQLCVASIDALGHLLRVRERAGRTTPKKGVCFVDQLDARLFRRDVYGYN